MVTSVTGLTKERMLAIEAASIVSGLVDENGDLLLETRGGEEVNAGNVIGPKGEKGDGWSKLGSNKPVTDIPSQYPLGLSVFGYTDAAGWPVSYGTVFTVLDSTVRGFQLISQKSSTAGELWYRVVADDAWGPFRKFVVSDNGYMTTDRIRLTATNDASATSTAHPFQIGPDTGDNVIIDGNEIMSRSNGVGKPLYNEFGYRTGADPSTADDLTRKGYVDSTTVPVTQVLGSGVNLNSLTTTGTYVQPTNANATTSLNYPEARAGMLEVVARPGIGVIAMIWQRYSLYNSGSTFTGVYERSHYNGTWTSWALVYDPPTDAFFSWASSLYSNIDTGVYNNVGAMRKQNGIVETFGGSVRFTSSASITRGTAYTFATIPSGYRPDFVYMGTAHSYALPEAVFNIYAYPDGNFRYISSLTATMPASGYFIMHPMKWKVP